ncbi:citrate lyase acyl carrier protein [Carboxylicivirga sediminis]|uniref:Citrate lyase acyl carrier protein n=1 Tax=Carboxylicivirga sediminis TaxID=2006564 RepID=A0A941F1E4_9BACT|nr:citrate lyase acyl carrier protein [Carboxylicivirga sediminis]MBR8534632.1 citrate lyase acyl carrier protein [Carboxylicivirga sediminis]
MELKTKAQAGSFESSDVLILVEPVEKGAGRIIELKSIVMQQFGDDLLGQIHANLDDFKIDDVRLIINDKGALPPTVSARLETALKRAAQLQSGTLK